MHAKAAIRCAALVCAWAAATLLPSPLCAQAPPDPDPPDVPSLVRAFRSSDDPSRRAAIAEQLLGAGENGARQLFNETRLRFTRLHKQFEKNRRKHLKAFAKAAPRAVARQTRGHDARIDTLRTRVREVTRSAGLSKETIRARADPALAELTSLLTVTVDAVLEGDPALGSDARALDVLMDELWEIYEIEERAADAVWKSAAGQRFLRNYEPPPNPAEYRAALGVERGFLAFTATPIGRRDAKVLAQNRELGAKIDPSEAEGIRILNRTRLVLGLNALAIDVELCTAAREHSDDMRRLGFFSHTSPVEGKRTPGQRAARAGTSGGAENIARGAGTADAAIRMWWYSPGHHKNMMGGHGRIGLGRSQAHWTQMFGG